ncbi:MAG TPA: VOC family protein [Candidatus Paceibacterota bacterium]
MQKIIPHLWFDKEAVEAANFYTSAFKDSAIIKKVTLRDTPSGDTDLVTFKLMGQEFMAISAGPYFKPNAAISFMVACDTTEEVDRLWDILIQGGEAMMEKAEYPFSKNYGWVKDKYGFTWQIMHDGGMPVQKITPSLMFAGPKAGSARKAMELYTSVFPNSGPLEGEGHISEYGEAAQAPDKPDMLQYARFKIYGQELVVMDSAYEHQFDFNESVSLLVNCDTQEEIDAYSNALSAVPEAEQCGWIKDQFGVSWQMNPSIMNDIMSSSDQVAVDRATRAFLKMKRFDIQKLKDAYEGKA